jgi:NitT/TauT family transport system permease protein
MTTDVLTAAPAAPSLLARAGRGRALPVVTMLLAILALWYVGTVLLNAQLQIDQFERDGTPWTTTDLIAATMRMERPILPAPHQVAVEMKQTIFDLRPTSKRSLVYHSWVTLSSTLLGFAMGTVIGILLAAGIVHVPTLEKSLMPWIISSQTIPILAIAPMVVVVLGAIGLTGLVPKAIISTYLCFFPVAIGMVKGLRSPDVLQMDLMRTYSASRWQTLRLLRGPASVPFLFASLKVAVAISLVGAIVGELPTGAQAGLGARLLTGSYYGQTVQIWSALMAAAILAGAMVGCVGLIEKTVGRIMGGRP